MRKTREILRLHFEASCSHRQIARSVGVALSTVQDCLRRVRLAALSWPLPDWDEAQLARTLYPPRATVETIPLPDFAHIDRELRHKGVTLLLLWQEYKTEQPHGVQYSQFCVHVARWRGKQDAVLRQYHAPGDKLFIDYAGTTMEVIDHHSGEVRTAQIFVAVMGASNYTFAEATPGHNPYRTGWVRNVAPWNFWVVYRKHWCRII